MTDNYTNNTEKRPLVSFIITYYNLPVEMLCECLDSILQLSLRPFEREIIVVDDGSDISPINELVNYREQIIYIRQANAGLSVARNTAINICKGKYIQFVDGDDYLIQTPYEHCLDIARYDQEVDMIMFDFSNTKNIPTSYEDRQPESGSMFLLHHNLHGAAWGYLFRRNILGELRFTPGRYHEDEEFTPQLVLRAESVVRTTAKAYFYRKRKESIIHKDNIRHHLKRLDDTEYIINHLNTIADRMPVQDRQAMQRRIAQLTMAHIYNVITLTRLKEYLYKTLERLRQKGLFPLPDKDYTQKYKWFRRMTNSKAGLNILLYTLPYLKKES